MHFSSLLSVLAFVIKLKIASSAPNLDPNGETLLWNPVNLANFKESTNLLPSDSTSQLLGTKLNPDTPVLEPIENSVASSQPQYGDSSANLGTEKASPAVLPSQLLAKVELNCRKGMLAFCCFGVPYLDFFGNVNVPLCIGWGPECKEFDGDEWCCLGRTKDERGEGRVCEGPQETPKETLEETPEEKQQETEMCPAGSKCE